MMTRAPTGFRVHRLPRFPGVLLGISSLACVERVELAGVRQDLDKAPIQGISGLGAVIIDGAEDGDTPTGLDMLPESTDATLGDIDGDGRTDWLLLRMDQWGVVYGGVRPAPGAPLSPSLGEFISIYPQPERYGGHTELRFLGDIDGDGQGDVGLSTSLSTFGTPSGPRPANNPAVLWTEQVASLKYGEPERRSGNLLQGVVEFSNPRPEDPSDAFIDNLPLEAVAYRAGKGMRMQGLGDVDADGFDDFALTVSAGCSAHNQPLWVSGDTVILQEEDFVSYVLYGAAERITSGAAALESAAWFPGVSWVRAVGDVDGDGFADFIARSENTLRLHLVAGRAERWQGQVDATQSARIDYDGFGIGARGLGDLDADGYDDFVVEISGGAPYFLFYGGPELWTRELHTRYSDASLGGGILPLGDWNGDGFHDLILDERTRAQVALGGPERITGRYAAPHDDTEYDYDPGSLPPREPVVTPVPAGDIDGDGYDDIGFVFSDTSGPTKAFIKYGGPPDVEIH